MLKNFLKRFWLSLIDAPRGYAQGGVLPGKPADRGDDEMVPLSPGEYWPPELANHWPPEMLEKLNKANELDPKVWSKYPSLMDDFDRLFKKFTGLFVTLWVAGILLSLTVAGVVIWGIVKLVLHFT